MKKIEKAINALLIGTVLATAGINARAQSGASSDPPSSSNQTYSSSPSQSGYRSTAQPSSTYISPTGQSARGAGEKGVTFYEFYGGSATSAGYITDLETTVGYNFNQYFGIDFGVPLYIAGATADRTLRTPAGQPFNASFSTAGLGDVYTDLRFTRFSPVLNYLGSVRVGAPTGSIRKGLSTGHVTFDWDNYFDRDFGRFRPYVDAGLANSILDTHDLYRPFTTYGYVAAFEGGGSIEIVSPLRVGASVYDDAPFGSQTVFRRPGGREIRGPAAIDRDDGVSAWINVRPTSVMSVEIGYDRSIRYDLNSFSFGVLFDVAGTFRRIRAMH